MSYRTLGSLIQEARKNSKTITRKKLAYGICSEQTLFEIETNQCMPDILMLDILLQRLGQSPDKLEIIINADNYKMVRMRDLLETTILRKKRERATQILQKYPSRSKIDKMYRCRMQASLYYYIDKNITGTIEYLKKAIHTTLPKFSYENIEDYLISEIEMENILELERMKLEQKSDIKNNLQICLKYIDQHFIHEEYAKLYSKCIWLLTAVFYQEGEYMQVLALCEKAIELLRKNAMLYYMLPLLNRIVKAGEQLGIAPKRNKWTKYCEILTFLWEHTAPKWYPTDSLFHNCYQRTYHLDYEFIRSERIAQGLTQEKLAEGIYRNPESLSRVETGKVSPNKQTFEKLMEKLGFEKGRYNGYVVTNSFETMELRDELDRLIMRNRYQEGEKILDKLKCSLDIQIPENKQVIELHHIIIAKHLEEITPLQALEKLKELFSCFGSFNNKTFHHIPRRNETVIINNLCILLYDLKQEKEAYSLCKTALQIIQNSKINVKYNYKAYSLLLNNYIHLCKNLHYESEERKFAFIALKNEFICGKASSLPFCINNVLQILDKDGTPPAECDKWAEAIYYMSDLYYFNKEKELYKNFLINERHINIIHQ